MRALTLAVMCTNKLEAGSWQFQMIVVLVQATLRMAY